MLSMVKKLISVDEGLWKRVKASAAGRGLTLSETVNTALTRWLAEGAPMTAESPSILVNLPPSVATDAARYMAPEPVKPKAEKIAEVRAAVAAVTGKPADDARCGACGERWAFHQGGQSGTRGRNNCPKFREA